MDQDKTAMDEGAIVNSGPEPKLAAGAGNFKIKVSYKGTELGWWKDVGGPEYWITTGDKASALSFYWVFYNGSPYLSAGSNNYLSYRTGSPYALGMKMRGWAYAAKWDLTGNKLKCLDNGNLVGVDGTSFYVNGENVVDVEFSSV
jgi:hypothetical protein